MWADASSVCLCHLFYIVETAIRVEFVKSEVALLADNSLGRQGAGVRFPEALNVLTNITVYSTLFCI